MTEKTLADDSVRFSGHFGRDHFEMSHIMARRCLMTVGTVARRRGRVFVIRNGPLLRAVTGCAVISEKLKMLVIIDVTSSAVESAFQRTDFNIARWQCRLRLTTRKPVIQPIQSCQCLAVFSSLRELMLPNGREQIMIHFRKAGGRMAMFLMTLGAVPNVCVKCRWLTLENGFCVGMADDAIGILHSLKRRVTGCTVIGERRMSLRKRPRTGQHPQSRSIIAKEQPDHQTQTGDQTKNEPCSFQESHRKP